jgi:hypothetical protein
MPHYLQHNHLYKRQGAALMLMLTILVIGAATLLVSSLSHSAAQIERDQKTADALAQAKDALIGDAVSQTLVTSAGYLRLPDLGFMIGLTPSEGSSAPNFSGNSKDYSVIGKLPWRTLGLKPLRDGQGECPWYVVSGHFKNTPITDALNWDTLGQINLADGNGNIIASNLAALVVAPGQALDGQNRTLSDPTYVQCGGNYDARNYLDPYASSNAISGAINYFIGGTNNRVTLNTNNNLLVMKGSGHYNDRFLFITSDEIFRVVMRRTDFSVQVSALLSDAYFQSVVIAGAKGTDNVNCNLLGSSNRTFCKNWIEMLLLTQLPTPAPVTIDGAPTAACSRILLFGGQKNTAQFRLTAANKATPSNYIEGMNLSAFATPVAVASSFVGVSVFSAKKPSADVLKCLS